jgi:hypothetical protein
MLLLLSLLACRCDGLNPPQDVRFDRHELHQVGGKFSGQADVLLEPAVAFALQQRCPRLESAHLRDANAMIHFVTLKGSGLDAVKKVEAALPDGKLASVQFAPVDGGIEFPVACAKCEVYFGLVVDGRASACFGPGYSLTVEDGRIVP